MMMCTNEFNRAGTKAEEGEENENQNKKKPRIDLLEPVGIHLMTIQQMMNMLL